MKKYYAWLTVVLMALAMAAGAQDRGSQAPVNPEFKEYVENKAYLKGGVLTSEGHALGLVPSPVEPVIRPAEDVEAPAGAGMVRQSQSLPSSYDLRDEGGVTSVKDQGQCGSCWTFATMGAIESRWLLQGYGTFDLSEDNMNNCHGYDYAPCEGGNLNISSSMLAQGAGPMDEADDPYSGVDDNTCPSGLTPVAYVSDTWWLDTTRANLKQAIQDYGALYASTYWSSDGYNSADYTYFYQGPGDGSDGGGGHAVLLVGWDDSKVTAADKPGAWIIRNSWSDSWGESGYYYMSYYDSVGVKTAGVFPDRVEYNEEAVIHGYDELGWTTSYGWSDGSDQAIVKFTPAADQQIRSIGTYAVASGSVLDIEVFDDFDGSTLSNSLATLSSQTCAHAGYHTFDLPDPIDVAAGNDLFIRVVYNTGTDYPIPMEKVISDYTSNAVIEDSGRCWVSSEGSTWFALGANITNGAYDVSIKALATAASGGGSGTDQSATPFTWLNPHPQGNSIYDSHFISETEGFACGSAGSFMKTTDGGESWTLMDADTLDEALSGIYFINADTGFVTGRGFIRLTEDGGQSWVNLPTGTNNTMRDIQFIDQQTGIAVGFSGTVIRTTDGGQNWTEVNSNTTESLNALFFVDASHGWAVGRDGAIIRSTDGGQTWSASIHGTEDLNGVHFTDANHGFAVGDVGNIYSTTDGGSNWTLYSGSGDIWTDFHDVWFADASTGLAVGGGYVYKTNDGGAQWTKKFANYRYGQRTIGAKTTSSHLVMGDYGVIIASQDGGETWTFPFGSRYETITGMDFAGSTGYAVTDGDSVMRTTDGGVTWSSLPFADYLNDVVTLDANTAIGVGSDGEAYKTVDGGQTWNDYGLNIYDDVEAVADAGNNTLYAAGLDTLIMKSTDLGDSWNKLTAPDIPEINFTDLYFVDDKTGVVIGGGGSTEPHILRTGDGGDQWTKVASPVQEALNSIAFVEDSIGFICGNNATLLKSTDSGRTWMQQTVNIPSGFIIDNLEAIRMQDAQNGVLVGSQGLVFTTSDGGSTWNYVQNRTFNLLTGVELLNGDAIISGYEGTVLHQEIGFETSLSAGFTADVTSGNAPLTVNFTDQSQGGVTSWSWDFNNDGSEDASAQNPAYEYTQAGTYTVGLTVGDGSTTANEIKMDYITVSSDGSGDIVSTEQGGLWSETTTWVGGVVPTASDNVVIDGKVEVDETGYCNNLTVNESDTLQNLSALYGKQVEVGGSVINNGLIRNHPDDNGDLVLEITGDIENNGTWANELTILSGSSDQTIRMRHPGKFVQGRLQDNDAAFDVVAGSPLVFSEGFSIDLEDPSGQPGRMVLPPASNFSLRLDSADIKHARIVGNGNDLEVLHNGYLDSCTYLEDLVLKGTVTIEGDSDIFAEGDSLRLEGTLQDHVGDAYNETLVINTRFINHGVIRNNPGGNNELILEVNGDVIHQGTWENGLNYFKGSVDQTIDMTNSDGIPADVRFYSMKGTGSYQWYHDGAELNGETGEYLEMEGLAFDDYGTYHCSTDAGDSRSIVVTGDVTLSAGFTADVTAGKAPLTVAFTDQSQGSITSWSWDFDGDGAEDATTQHPEYTYDQAGTYTVSLTVSDGTHSDELMRSDYITVDAAADCSWDFASGPYVMNFESDEDLSGWVTWDANSDDNTWMISAASGVDGTQAAGYGYSEVNAADDWLFSRCFDLEGGESYAISFYYAVESSTFPEKLKLAMGTAADPSSMDEVIRDLGTIVNTDFHKSVDTVNVETASTWYFGWHAYSDANMWNLYIDSVKIEEVVAEPLEVDFTADVVSGTAPLTVNFTDQSGSNATSWKWDFNDDGTVDATNQNPGYTYNDPGTYTVSLEVSDGGQSVTQTRTDYITVDEQTGLSNLAGEYGIVVYPNPASEKATISLEDAGAVERVELTGLGGNKLAEWGAGQWDQNRLSIEISQYNAGVYLIRLHLEKEVITRKLIIE